MPQTFSNHAGGLSAPFAQLAAVTAGVDLDTPSRGLYVGGAGDVAVTTIGGTTATFIDVPAGAVLPIRATRVESTGTTATNIIAGW